MANVGKGTDKGRSANAGTGIFYKAVVHMELQYGSESWVITGSTLTIIEGFHHRAARKIMDKRTVGRLYVAVVQAVLLFGSEKWVLIPRLENALEGFHHRAAQKMAVMGPKRQPNGKWVYPPIGEKLAMVGLEEIGVYIARRHNTFAQYIANHPIMDLCLLEERKPVMQLSMQWW